jgi:hypothetical protein
MDVDQLRTQPVQTFSVHGGPGSFVGASCMFKSAIALSYPKGEGRQTHLSRVDWEILERPPDPNLTLCLGILLANHRVQSGDGPRVCSTGPRESERLSREGTYKDRTDEDDEEGATRTWTRTLCLFLFIWRVRTAMGRGGTEIHETIFS